MKLLLIDDDTKIAIEVERGLGAKGSIVGVAFVYAIGRSCGAYPSAGTTPVAPLRAAL